MGEDTRPSQDTVGISGNVAHVFYDKDAVEIKLADTIDSDKYGGNFIKDVCIDEGMLFHPKILEEIPKDRRPSPNVTCQMTEANSDLVYWKKNDARKSVNELKPEAIVPVDLAPKFKNEKQYSTGKEYVSHDGEITTDDIAGDPGEKKISLQELLLLESAEESRLASTINCESSEKQHPAHEGAAGQATIHDSHEIQAIVPQTSDHVSSDVSSTMSEDQGAALDVKRSNQIDRRTHFIDHRSRSRAVEDISEPACPIPAITGDASTEPTCTASNTDGFNGVVSGSTGLTEIRTAESGLDATNASNPDIRLSEKNNNDSENPASMAINEAVDEAAIATASPRNNADHSDLDGETQEKCDVGSVSEIHGLSQIVEETGTDTDNTVSKTLAHLDSAMAQTVPESSSSTARTGNGDPYDPYESNLVGPSIMSARVSSSGHLAYSGSISLRSDGSTTSTRSFAFPVLQREWVSSPVRMAKAERRRHLGWRRGLICCKF